MNKSTAQLTSFNKGKKYRFTKGNLIDDGTIPSDGSIIKVMSARGNCVRYVMFSGEEPISKCRHFYKHSEMAQNLKEI